MSEYDYEEKIEGAHFSIKLTKSQTTALRGLESLFKAGLIRSVVFNEIDSEPIEKINEVVLERRINFFIDLTEYRQISILVSKQEGNEWTSNKAVIYSNRGAWRTSGT
jgi:hypothetical protein